MSRLIDTCLKPRRVLCFFLLLSVSSCSIHAFDEFLYDIQLIDRLADVGMKNYALLHIDRLFKKYPDRKDHIYYAKARFHYKLNERRQGEESISQIPPGSPFYIESQLIVAEEALRKGQLDSAEKAYAEYFRQVQKPAGQDPAAVQAFQEAATYYAQVQIEKGDGRKAVEVLGFLKNIEGQEAPDPDQLILTIAQATYRATEERLKRNEPIDKELIKEQIEALLDIQWRHSGHSPITVDAYIQAARGQIYLGQYEEALNTLKTVSESAAIVAEQVSTSRSPLPAAFYYYARIFDELGRQSLAKDDMEDAQQKFMIAATFYNERLMEAFPQAPQANEALVYYGKLSETVKEHFGVDLPAPSGTGTSDFPVAVEEGDRYYDVDDYEKAIDAYLKAMKMGRLNRQIPAIATRLIYSLGKQGRLLEAAAIASYLGDVFSDADQTPIAMLQVGQLMFKKAQELPDGEKKESQLAEAMQIWSQFVNIAPGHPKAPDIAFFLAEMKYAEAEKLATASRDIDDPREKERLKDEAREKFIESIPYYITMTEEFSATPQGVRALYKLGWVYYNTGQNNEAADYFLQYVRRETDPARDKDRLLAKFHAAEQLMFSDSPTDAVEHFRELLSWFEEGGGGPDTNVQGAEKIKENATNYIGWSYDLSAEQFRPELNRIKNRIALLEDKTVVANDIIEQAKIAIELAENNRKEAENELKDHQEIINEPLPEPEKRALQETMPPDEEMKALSEDERRQMVAYAKERSEEVAVQFRQQDIDNFIGENAALEERKREVATTLQTQKTQLENQQALLQQQQNEAEKLAEEQEKLEQYIQDLTQPIQNARQDIETMENELKEVREKFSTAVQTARNHADEETRQKAAALARKLQEDGRTLTSDLTEAKKALERRLPPDFKQQSEELHDRLARTTAKLEEVNGQIRNLSDQVQVLNTDVVILENTLDAYDRMMAFNEARIKILRQDSDDRSTVAEEIGLDEKRAAANAAWKNVYETKVARSRVIEEQSSERIEAAKAEIEAAKTKIAELEEERKPIFERMLERKEVALNAFLEFLNAYPDSKYVPSQMARVGTIYIEKKNYEKAVEYLNELAERFPNEDVTTNAIFDLGRAQFEIGDMDNAVKTFNRILDKAEEQSTNNLNFLANAMMEAGKPEISVPVLEELLRRAENPNHKDYERLYGENGKMYERLIFKTANAALEAELFDKVVRYSDKLLELNEKTAYFFQLKMGLAKAKREQTPPDYQGAVDALTEILRFAQDETMKNEARLELVDTFMMNEQLGEQAYRRALGQLGQLAVVADDEVILLADPDNEAQRPFVEEALYKMAVCYSILGEDKQKETVVQKYKEIFPTGNYSSEINALPAAEF